jgi:hypothetical protein
MNSPKMAIVAYCVALGIILAVAFHSAPDRLAAADAPSPTTVTDSK